MRNTTILIIARNELQETQRCIDSLRWFNDLEQLSVILVDNASIDGLREWALGEQDFTYVYMDEGYTCYAGIINRVRKELKVEDDILIMNGAYILTPFCLSNMKKALYHKKNVGAVGPLCNRFWYDQNFGDKLSSFDDVLTAAHQAESVDMKRSMCLNSGAIMYKREALEAVGSFDEELSEAESCVLDYGFRLFLENYQLFICRDALLWSNRLTFTASGYYGDNRADSDLLGRKWGMKYFNTFYDSNLMNCIKRDSEDTFSVLEIGCDCGANLLEIKSRYPNARIRGIEINEHAAKIASKICEISIADIEKDTVPCESQEFDYILFGNVLEHLGNPERAVINCRRLLKPEGELISVIPNLMHISVMEELIRGNFTYSDTGLLDCTHIHLFTCNEIVRMFGRAGYQIRLEGVTTPVTGKQKELIDTLLTLSPEAERHMYETFQYIVTAEIAL